MGELETIEGEGYNVSAEVIPSSPFRVDQSTVTARFPGLDLGMEALYRLFIRKYPEDASTLESDLRNTPVYATTPHAERVVRRDEFFRIYNSLAFYAADYICNQEDKETALSSVESEITSTFGSTVADKYVDEALKRINGHNALSGYIRQLSAQTINEITTRADGDPTILYEVAKIFADPKRPGLEGTHMSDIIPSNMAHALDTLQGSPLCRQIKKSLDEGIFDKFLAQDIVSFIDQGLDTDGSYARISQLIGFSEGIIDAQTDEERRSVRDRMLGRVALWPADQQSALQAARAQFAASLDAAHRYNHTLVTFNISSMNEVSLDLLRAKIKDVSLQAAITLGRFTMPRVQQAHIAKVRKGLRRQMSQLIDSQEENEAATPPNEPVRLGRLDSATGEFTEGQDAVEQVMKTYLDRYGRNNDKLRADVTKIVGHFHNIDFRSGQVRGVKKLETPMRLPDRTEALWELKPLEANGLSTSSALAKGIRVIFSRLPDNTVGLIEIGDRRDIPKLLERLRRATTA